MSTLLLTVNDARVDAYVRRNDVNNVPQWDPRVARRLQPLQQLRRPVTTDSSAWWA